MTKKTAAEILKHEETTAKIYLKDFEAYYKWFEEHKEYNKANYW